MFLLKDAKMKICCVAKIKARKNKEKQKTRKKKSTTNNNKNHPLKLVVQEQKYGKRNRNH